MSCIVNDYPAELLHAFDHADKPFMSVMAVTMDQKTVERFNGSYDKRAGPGQAQRTLGGNAVICGAFGCVQECLSTVLVGESCLFFQPLPKKDNKAIEISKLFSTRLSLKKFDGVFIHLTRFQDGKPAPNCITKMAATALIRLAPEGRFNKIPGFKDLPKAAKLHLCETIYYHFVAVGPAKALPATPQPSLPYKGGEVRHISVKDYDYASYADMVEARDGSEAKFKLLKHGKKFHTHHIDTSLPAVLIGGQDNPARSEAIPLFNPVAER